MSHTSIKQLETEIAREQAIDRIVQRRIPSDRAYRNAESAEAQQAREKEIVVEAERQIRGAGAQ